MVYHNCWNLNNRNPRLVAIIFIKNMGLECTKVATSRSPKPNPIKATIYPPRKISPQVILPEIWIKVQANPSSRNNQRPQPNAQRFTTYSQKVAENHDSVKFAQNVGFFHDNLKNQSSKDQIQFVFSKTVNKNYVVSLYGIEKDQLYKIVQPEGMLFEQRDEILIGKSLLKLKYWLQPHETIKMKNKTEVKLNLCKDEKAQCRICLEPGTDPLNPLVQPCKCIGSVSAIHQRCLSKWIFTNRDSFSENMSFYKVNVKNWQCEICNCSFKSYIWYRLMSITTYFPGHYAIFQIRNQKQGVTEEGPAFAICKFIDQKPNMIIGNVQNAQFYLSNANKQEIKLKLTKIDSNLFIINQSQQTFPYIIAQTNYLSYNQEYKLRNMYLMVAK